MTFMRRQASVPLAILTALTVGCGPTASPPAAAGTVPEPAPKAAPEPTAEAARPLSNPQADSIRESRTRAVAAVLERIAGREDEPAAEVFENVRILGAVPAGRLLRIMDIGFGRSLGVGCDHCHVPGNPASDDKRPKRAARAMLRMVERINGELLASIDELEGPRPTVNCTTCHRGDVVPATAMP